MFTVLQNLRYRTKNLQRPLYWCFCIQIEVKVSPQQDVSRQTTKLFDGTLATLVLECKDKVVWNDFTILRRKSNNLLLKLKEILLNKGNKTFLNKNIYPRRLFLSLFLILPIVKM